MQIQLCYIQKAIQDGVYQNLGAAELAPEESTSIPPLLIIVIVLGVVLAVAIVTIITIAVALCW